MSLSRIPGDEREAKVSPDARQTVRRACAFFVALLLAAQPAFAYAVDTHAALVDLIWNDSIRPLLLKRYPGTTEAELREAHAFAYGGCVIQDLGYYPFGKEIFSNLAHYVRSGDFVTALLHNAKNANELAFAIGALAHFVGDSFGHARAVNPSVGITFPDLAKKYGSIVTYEDGRIAHGRVEFGFDVAQLAWHRYAPHAYRKYIGFQVSGSLLDRAFYETYGLTVRSVLGPQRSAIKSYRFSVRRLLPEFLKIEVINQRDDLPVEIQNAARQEFLDNISQTEYARHWGNSYRKPGFGAHLLAFIVRIIPKIGVLKILAIKAPSATTEDLFLTSMNVSCSRLRELLNRFSSSPSGELTLANRDLDTGEKIRPGSYIRTDKTYAELLEKVAGKKIPAGLRDDILDYYSDPNAPISTKKNAKKWAKVLAELAMLKASAEARLD